jgi:hypothetical protein
MYARDLGAPFHLDEAAPQYRRHHEDVGDAVAGKHFGDDFGAHPFGIMSDIGHC